MERKNYCMYGNIMYSQRDNSITKQEVTSGKNKINMTLSKQAARSKTGTIINDISHEIAIRL
ncbi:hypothetical protein [Chryseobacterium limigenitum]